MLYLENDQTVRSAGSQVNDLEKLLTHPRDRQEMEAAYATAKAQVAALVDRNGREVVMGWLMRGLPSDIAARAKADHAAQN